VQTAEGWSRVAGVPAVAVIPEGSGHANAVSGLATAWAEASPVIMISGADDSRNLGKGAIQELPQVALCQPITKWSVLVTDTRRIPEHVAAAFRLAMTGFPGPVHLSVPADVLETAVDERDAPVTAPAASRPTHASEPGAAFVDQAVDLLARAERPAMIAGMGAFWSGAGDALRRLVETTRVPLFTVERARGLVSDEHPGCFGDGYTSVNPAAENLHHADVVLLLGEKVDCRLAYGYSFGHARLIHVSPDPAEIGRNRAVTLGAGCDTGAAIARLLEAAEARRWTERTPWVECLRAARRQHEERMRALADATDVPPHPVRIAAEVERLLAPDTVLVFDGGDFSGWVRAWLKARRPGGWQLSTVLGHLGTGLPYAIGAALAAPDSRVVLLTGDGSLGFSVMEFETAIRHRLPIVVVVGSDAAWGIEECFQAAWYGPDRLVNTKLTPVRWDRMAQAMGGWGEQVERPEELRPALERAFAAGVPACVNVTTKTLASPMAEAFARVFARRRGRTRQSREP
jgi:acetolactate synthase-1/2/3 large subunit